MLSLIKCVWCVCRLRPVCDVQTADRHRTVPRDGPSVQCLDRWNLRRKVWVARASVCATKHLRCWLSTAAAVPPVTNSLREPRLIVYLRISICRSRRACNAWHPRVCWCLRIRPRGLCRSPINKYQLLIVGI